ncbi:MAG TPA: hypothetical protein VGL44_09145 [Gaiellales bacterium]
MTLEQDSQIAALLEVHTPSRPVGGEWAGVLAIAGRRRRLVWPLGGRRPVRRLALLAVAAFVVGVPVALARTGVWSRDLSGPATPHQRAQVAAFNTWAHLHHAIGPLRQLVTLHASGSTFTYVAARIRGKDGYCVYQIAKRGHLQYTDSQCGWSPNHRHPRVSNDGEGPGSALDAYVWLLSLGSKEWPRVNAWIVVGDLPRGVRTVDAQFQDGSTAPAAISGRFFSYVVDGAHITAGHRPVAFVGLNARGTTIHRQEFDPRTFDMRFILRVTRNPHCHFQLSHHEACDSLR